MRYSFIILFSIILFSCGDSAKKAPEAVEDTTPKTKYTLTAFDASTAYPDAKLSNMVYENGKFTFDVTGENYKLGEQTPDAPQKMCANSGKGQHIHLIVDKKPYSAQYTNSFDHEVEAVSYTHLTLPTTSRV